MQPSIAYERAWTRLVLLLVVGLTGFFVITEWDGLVRLVEWLAAGLAAAPDSLRAVVENYTALPPTQIAPSLLIGALVGGVGTALVLGTRALSTLIVGALLGAVGSQVFAATLRHCTDALEASAVERLIGFGISGISSLIALFPYWTWRKRSAQTSTSGYFRRPLLALLLLAPSLASLALFLYYPSIQTVLLSLNARRFPLPQERFVCLGNYVSLAQDTPYQTSFGVTLFVTVLIVLFSLATALGIATLASQPIRGASIYRTLLIWPFALSPIVTGVIFLALFREGSSGLINFVTSSAFGVEPAWLRDPNLARWVIVLASVWNILGFNILFYVAGLQNVPKDLLEAAQIDGANRVQRFFRITFPLLSPYTFFLLVTNVTYAFYGIYGAVDALTQGGPPLGPAGQFGGATSVLIYKLYEDAFTPGAPIGQAAAQALILFLGVASLTLLQFRFVERRVTYAD
jgi:sn-glycerol 3-phosphate transport system permease protein